MQLKIVNSDNIEAIRQKITARLQSGKAVSIKQPLDTKDVIPQKESPRKNSQGIQGESINATQDEQIIEIKATVQKVRGLNQFSFGQISPKFYIKPNLVKLNNKFYEDQPAANLLEPQQQRVTKRSKPKGDLIKVREYTDTQNWAQHQSKSHLLSRQQAPTHSDLLSAVENYGANYEKQNWDEDTIKVGSLNDTEGSFNSKNGTSNFYNSTMKRRQADSFSKTPCFIKSPRSLASSNHYRKGHEDEHHIDSMKKAQYTRMVNKQLSQSSDEIAHAVNIFYEQNAHHFTPNTGVAFRPSLLQKHQANKPPAEQMNSSMYGFSRQSNFKQQTNAKFKAISQTVRNTGRQSPINMMPERKIGWGNQIIQQANLLKVSEQVSSGKQSVKEEKPHYGYGLSEMQSKAQVQRKNKQIFQQHR